MAIVTPVETPVGSRRRLAIASPATLEPIGEIEVQTAEEVRAAVDAARKAQPAWAALDFGERARIVRRALDVLLARQDEFIATVISETGKTRTEALMMEIYASCDVINYYAKHAERILRTERLRPHGLMRLMKKVRIVYRPLGVVGVISPWNGPLILSLNPTVQALMAGNAVVLKPSEVTPFSGQIPREIFEQAGLPDGLFHVLWATARRARRSPRRAATRSPSPGAWPPGARWRSPAPSASRRARSSWAARTP